MQRADIFFRGEQEQTLLFISIFIYYFLFLMRSHCQKAAQSAIETDGRRSNIGSVYCATPEARFFIFFWGDKQNTSHSYEPQTEKLKVQNMKKKKKKRLLIREAMLSLAGTELWGSQGRTLATTNDKSLRLQALKNHHEVKKPKKTSQTIIGLTHTSYTSSPQPRRPSRVAT